MKKTSYLIPIFLIILLINPAYGFAGMGNNNTAPALELANVTDSDQDIILLQHLIEIDAVRFESENKLYVRETLAFKNMGEKNFSGSLRTWLPDGIEAMSVSKVEMMTNVPSTPLQAVQNGNIISWQASIEASTPLFPLYAVEYVMSAEPKGGITISKLYSKKLLYPTLINKPPVSIVLKVTKNAADSITLTDEKGSSISAAGNPREEEGSVLYMWDTVDFRDINIALSRSSLTSVSGYAGYAVLGLLIILILSYPIIRKKSEKLQAFEDRIRNSLKREPQETAEEVEEETIEEAVEETGEVSGPEEEELSGKTKDELEAEKSELLLKLDELEKDYSSGNLLDEEYEELRGEYRSKLGQVNKRLKESG